MVYSNPHSFFPFKIQHSVIQNSPPMVNRKLTDTEKAAKIKESFDALEDQRTLGIQRSQDQQQTKDIAQQRERKRLVAKYGENHARVAKVDRQLTTNPRLFKAYDQEVVRSKTRVPTTDPNTWMVYGTIRDENDKRLSGLTVSLFDEKGKWIRPLGLTCSDENGLYSLQVKDETGELAKKYAKTAMFLRVTNDDKEVLHQEEEALFLVLGKVDNREIVLGEDACGTPPDDGVVVTGQCIVRGTVTDAKNNPIPGLLVKAVDQDVNGENPLGDQATVGEKGEYEIHYKAEEYILSRNEVGGPDIKLYVHDPNGELIHTTKVHNDSPKVTTINIILRSRGKAK